MRKKKHIGLNLCLTLYIFLISSATMILAVCIILGLLRFHIIKMPLFNDPIVGILIFLSLLSVAISTSMAPFLAHFPLRPLRRLIGAIDGLAEGDFSQRIHMDYPPELRHLPAATYQWFCKNYLDRYYPVRFMIRANGVTL